MPSKNVVKQYAEDNYYHAYNRGVAKQVIFHDAQDKKQFLRIIDRHLNPNNTDLRYDGVRYEKLHDELDILGYCLMGNHFHLLFYLKKGDRAVKKLMQSLLTSYTMYYNKKYKRVGSLFQGTFKASRIDSESYLQHISRYIHLNPRNYKTYFYSSYKSYAEDRTEPWLKTEKILGLFSTRNEYIEFVADYASHLNVLDELTHQLADG